MNKRVDFSALAVSADIGRINPIEDEVLTPTHSCPEITNNGIPLSHKTTSEQQCITRYRERSDCTKRCRILIDILRRNKIVQELVKCLNENCKQKLKCYRYTCEPSQKQQYRMFKLINKKCEYFIRND